MLPVRSLPWDQGAWLGGKMGGQFSPAPTLPLWGWASVFPLFSPWSKPKTLYLPGPSHCLEQLLALGMVFWKHRQKPAEASTPHRAETKSQVASILKAKPEGLEFQVGGPDMAFGPAKGTCDFHTQEISGALIC